MGQTTRKRVKKNKSRRLKEHEKKWKQLKDKELTLSNMQTETGEHRQQNSTEMGCGSGGRAGYPLVGRLLVRFLDARRY